SGVWVTGEEGVRVRWSCSWAKIVRKELRMSRGSSTASAIIGREGEKRRRNDVRSSYRRPGTFVTVPVLHRGWVIAQRR
ncbi:hypothetical protein PIB30_080011, partial [Stylosanthes scabra]|nr:hypothetical protein [Stylosanthes scabra]